MKNKTILLTLAICGSAIAAEPVKIEQLGWFAGCWGFEREGKRYEEVWLPPVADGAIGMARTLKQGRSVNHEFTRIVAGKDGAFVQTPFQVGVRMAEAGVLCSRAARFPPRSIG